MQPPTGGVHCLNGLNGLLQCQFIPAPLCHLTMSKVVQGFCFWWLPLLRLLFCIQSHVWFPQTPQSSRLQKATTEGTQSEVMPGSPRHRLGASDPWHVAEYLCHNGNQLVPTPTLSRHGCECGHTLWSGRVCRAQKAVDLVSPRWHQTPSHQVILHSAKWWCKQLKAEASMTMDWRLSHTLSGMCGN